MQNPPLTITFLGTGTSSGVPMIGCNCEVCQSNNPKDKRLRSSILVCSATTRIVIDTTPDFRYQMLRINNQKLDAVVYTHAHKDHIAGLDDVRAYNFTQQRAMDIYATEATQAALKKEFAYAFAEHKYPGVPELRLHTIATAPFQIGDIWLEPIQVWHHKMPVLGFKLGNFIYITDANAIDTEELEKLYGADILVLNALRKEAHISHFTLSQAVAIVAQTKVNQAYFTHISHQLGLHNAINASLPANIALAYDGLTLQIN